MGKAPDPRPAPPRGFAPDAYAARTAAAQRLMAARGLDALFLTTEPEIRYFSGFLTAFWQSPTRPWFLVLPATGKPIAVIPAIGVDLMQATWLDDIRTWDAPTPDDDGISLLTDLLAPLAARQARIGLLQGPETLLRMPLADFERLRAALPGLSWADATPLIQTLRMVKSDEEIAKIAHICSIAGRSFAQLPNLIADGDTLVDVFRRFRQTCLTEGADDIPYLVGGAGPGGYTNVIAPPSDRPLQAGDVLMLDTGAVWDGYFCDFDRNFAMGRAEPAAQRAYDTLWRATEAGLAVARPGATCRDLFHAMQKVIGTSDGAVGRFGHGLGMQLTEWPSHAAFDETVLVENMVITLEPSMSYGDGRVMVHEEDIVIRATGPELLTPRAPPDLPVIR